MTQFIIAIVLALVMLFLALKAVLSKSIRTAILAAGGVSLFASVLYLLLAAPDVAMTEAAIGSGLSTILFFYVLHRIQKGGRHA